MDKNPKKEADEKYPQSEGMDIHMSEGTIINLITTPREIRVKLGMSWSKATARMSNNEVTYRFVNYLDQCGLLKDNRKENGVGWRSFSYVDCIYLELVIALRKMGVKSDTLKYLYRVFSQPYTDKTAEVLGVHWLNVLICVHCGTEMEVLISTSDNIPIIADPVSMEIFGKNATDGQIRVSLSTMINKIRKQNNMSLIKINHSMKDSMLSHSELEAVFSIRNLRGEDEEIRIKKTKDGRVLVDKKRTETENTELAKDLDNIMKKHEIKDFSNVELAVRQGGIANIKVKTSNIFDK